MGVTIRLQRLGKLHQPFYRIGVFDRRTRREGAAIEIVGLYDPRNKDQGKITRLKKDRMEYWLSQGAEPSDTVASLMRDAAITVKKPTKAKNPKRKKHRRAKEVLKVKNLKQRSRRELKAKRLAAKATAEAGKGEKAE